MRWRKRSRSKRPAAGSSDDMVATLAALGIPIDFGVSDPQAALTGGFAKATIYRAHLSLESGDTGEAISSATAVIEYPGIGSNPSYGLVLAVAHYLRGTAREQDGALHEAREDYRAALTAAPGHSGARAALDRLG